MSRFVHQRHKPATDLEQERSLVVACPPMRSNVNLSRIARTAGCCGVRRLIACGNARIDSKIARDSGDWLHIELRRSLAPVVKALKNEGYRAVGLEQAQGSVSLHDFPFQRRTVLVIGHERLGIVDEVMQLLDGDDVNALSRCS